MSASRRPGRKDVAASRRISSSVRMTRGWRRGGEFSRPPDPIRHTAPARRGHNAALGDKLQRYGSLRDVSVQFANPTWPNLRVLSCVHAPRRFVKKSIAMWGGRRGGGGEGVGGAGKKKRQCSRAGTYPQPGGPTMRAHAHATVPPHPLSSNVSSFLQQRGRTEKGRDLYGNVKQP